MHGALYNPAAVQRLLTWLLRLCVMWTRREKLLGEWNWLSLGGRIRFDYSTPEKRMRRKGARSPMGTDLISMYGEVFTVSHLIRRWMPHEKSVPPVQARVQSRIHPWGSLIATYVSASIKDLMPFRGPHAITDIAYAWCTNRLETGPCTTWVDGDLTQVPSWLSLVQCAKEPAPFSISSVSCKIPSLAPFHCCPVHPSQLHAECYCRDKSWLPHS